MLEEVEECIEAPGEVFHSPHVQGRKDSSMLLILPSEEGKNITKHVLTRLQEVRGRV